MNFRPGRKRMRTDIFGPWVPAAELPLQDSDCMPAVLQKAKHILEFDFTPEPCDNPDGPQAVQIPFAIFDRVLENHGIDITGLTYSATKRGNLYRTHRLMVSV